MPSATEIVAAVCLGWYVFIVLVCSIGFVQLYRHYSCPPAPSISSKLSTKDVPHTTIIRPCKGREPYLYDCLASTFKQDYPKDKLTVYFCVASRDDSACVAITRLLQDYKQHDARLMVEDEDPMLTSGQPGLGPNPKIRNMSRAYREAKGDIVWILDCNVWVGQGVCGRMVDRLCGYSQKGQARPYKFVHHLPVAVDVPANLAFQYESAGRMSNDTPVAKMYSGELDRFGGRLDEAFLSSAHAKMYVAINTVAIAPCICGKSSMFRCSHLNALTNQDQSIETRFGSGIDYFSENICEDHLIGDLLWKAKIPNTMPADTKRWRNHGLVYGDIALQPVSAMSVSKYIARRVRWLRVRKFTVPVATLVEPGTESVLCSLIGAFGLTTLSLAQEYVGKGWKVMFALWLISMSGWCLADWAVYNLLQSGNTVETPTSGATSVPSFAQPSNRTNRSRRPFLTWLSSWLAREALTLPIWTWAIWGGVTVVWRDRKFWVGLDMKVHEVNEAMSDEQQQPLLLRDHEDTRRLDDGDPMQSNGRKVRRD